MGGQRTGLEDSEAAARNSELSVSLQNFQVDNQLLNASMPVVICRRERQLIDRGGGNQGLLKAAQREIERQRQGAPLLTLQCRVMLSNIRKTTEDSVVIKYGLPHQTSLRSLCLQRVHTFLLQGSSHSPGSRRSLPRRNFCRGPSKVWQSSTFERPAP